MDITIHDITRFIAKQRICLGDLHDFLFVLSRVEDGQSREVVVAEFMELATRYYHPGQYEMEMYRQHYNKLYDLSLACIEDARRHKAIQGAIINVNGYTNK